MRMSDLRAAILGYGLAGSVFHAPLIETTPGLAVGAVVTGNAERQAAALAAYPGARISPDADDLFAHADDIDFVVVATPNRTHAPLAKRSLDAGLPVVVDKPLAPAAAEAREVVEHAERLGVLLTVFMNRRWDSDFLEVKRLIAAGELGDVLRFESRFERWRPEPKPGAWREETPPGDGGGLLLDLGPHLVDQAIGLFGEVVDVHSEIDNRRGGAADDDVFLALPHASGTRSHIWASALAAAPGPRLRVLGSRSALVIEDLDGQEAALRSGVRPGMPEWGDGAWPVFYAELESALREGTPPPVDPREAITVLEVLDAARVAARR